MGLLTLILYLFTVASATSAGNTLLIDTEPSPSCDGDERASLGEGCDHSQLLQVQQVHSRGASSSLPAPPKREAKSPKSKSLQDLIDDALEDLIVFVDSKASISASNLRALKEVRSTSPVRTQMISLSFWTYGIHTFVNGWAGWSLAKSFIDTRPKNGLPGYDVAAIFVKEDQCVLAFSGTTGLADLTTDFTFDAINPQDFSPCGLEGVHEGFFGDVQQFMLNGTYEREFEPFLHQNCGGGITLTGHSQGAAMSEIFASCVNAGDSLLLPKLERDGKLINYGALLNTRFQVSSIYTCGSPGTARAGIKNPLNKSGVFDGERIFIQDPVFMDPVPASTSELFFWHPKMSALRLHKSNNTVVRGVSISPSNAWEPPLLLPTAYSLSVLDVELHLRYVEYLVNLTE